MCFLIHLDRLLSLLVCVCFPAHPEDPQFPVQPASCNSCCVCYHPQPAPSGPDLLRHAHLLQPCWWVVSPLPASASSVGSARRIALRFSPAGGVKCKNPPGFVFQSSPWAARSSPPYRASALMGSRSAPCRHGSSINWARQLLILWCE